MTHYPINGRAIWFYPFNWFAAVPFRKKKTSFLKPLDG